MTNYVMNEWTCSELSTMEDLQNVRTLISKGYDIVAVDTETSGLHIILDKPFCITMAFANIELKLGKAFIADFRNKSPRFIDLLQNLIYSCKKIVFWNAKFDLHMLYNIGMTALVDNPAITDAMIYARLAADAITARAGGVVLDLKNYSVKHIDSKAKTYEQVLSQYKKQIVIKRNEKLKSLGVKIGELNDFLKDKINDIKQLPYDVQRVLNAPEYNPHNYANIPWEILKKYAIFDAIFTMENFLHDRATTIKRSQMRIAEREEAIIPILWKMERAGFKLNILYLKTSKLELKKYILERREELRNIVGQELKVNQHEMIKNIFSSKYGIELTGSDEDHLKEIKEPEEAKRLADIIIELRSLEKWYSTYIIKWEENAQNLDRVYTNFNQVGAVSGRFSCDFQQFPKEPLRKADGTELFSPRRLIMVSGDNYDSLALIDYAAEELRIQAVYTILIGHPDLNLCRAYIPMNCTEKDGKYYLDEDPTKEWKPTDLHTLTTLTAFPNLSVDDPEFSHYRKIGKCTNFACNYNASKKTLITQFGYPEEMAERLYNAYHSVYPGVAKYREYVQNVLRTQDYISNLFNRRYYNCSWHNAANYLVQGSGADLLKIKLVQITNYLKEHNYKSRMLCLIHDEIMFEIDKDEHHIIPELKKIMESIPNSPIPFVAEPEITYSTWDKKKKVEC